MIQKIRIRFIAVAMAALFVLLAVIVTGMNIINYNASCLNDGTFTNGDTRKNDDTIS